METHTIYRVEHSTLGLGPWHAKRHPNFQDLTDEAQDAIYMANAAVNDRYYNDNGYRTKHIPVFDDFGYSFQSGIHYCAAPNLEELKSWFGNENCMNLLFDAGFTVKEYVVKRIRTSKTKKQCAFVRCDVLEEKDLTILALLD